MGVSKNCLNSEMTEAKNVVVQNIGSDMDFNFKNVIKVLLENNIIFPNLYKLFQIALSIPISSGIYGRCFSAIRKIKTWLRMLMLQDKFSDLSILYIKGVFLHGWED